MSNSASANYFNADKLCGLMNSSSGAASHTPGTGTSSNSSVSQSQTSKRTRDVPLWNASGFNDFNARVRTNEIFSDEASSGFSNDGRESPCGSHLSICTGSVNSGAHSPGAGNNSHEQERSRGEYARFTEDIMRLPNSPDGRARVVETPQITSNHRWVAVTNEVELKGMMPERSMCFNYPASILANQATCLTDFEKIDVADLSKTGDLVRVRAICQILSLVFAPLSHGLKSERHSDEQSNDKRNKGSPYDTYTFYRVGATDSSKKSPMFHIGYEEIFNNDLTKVTFIRIWLHIYNSFHSTSDLISQVMKDNNKVRRADQFGGMPIGSSNTKVIADLNRAAGAGITPSTLQNSMTKETFALQYMLIANTAEYRAQLENFGGGKQFILPEGADAFDLHANTYEELDGVPECGLGSTHPLAPEFIFNSKRPGGLSFGILNMDGSQADVHPAYLRLDSYWRAPDNVEFRMPELRCALMCIHPCLQVKTIANLPLMRKLSSVLPGRELMRLFLERKKPDVSEEVRNCTRPTSRPYPPARDAEMGTPVPGVEGDDMDLGRNRPVLEEIERREDEILFRPENTSSFDTYKNQIRNRTDMSDHEAEIARKGVVSDGSYTRHAKKPGVTGNIHEVVTLSTDRVAEQTNFLYEDLISEWITRANNQLDVFESSTNDVNEVKRRRVILQTRHATCIRELIQYHLKCIAVCFESNELRSTLPPGWLDVYRKLKEWVDLNDGSLSIPWVLAQRGQAPQMITSNDITVWHAWCEFKNTVLGPDCLIEGRDVHIMDHLMLHHFEAYIKESTLLVLSAAKSAGKSMRGERFQKLIGKEFVKNSFSKSSKAECNGGINQPENGRCNIYDEMPTQFSKKADDETIERQKSLFTSGETNHSRTEQGADGRYYTRSITTKFFISHVVCTNLGPAATDVKDDTEDEKYNAWCAGRVWSLHCRNETRAGVTNAQFDAHWNEPGVVERVRKFRLVFAIAAFLRIAMREVAFISPDMTFADKLFKEADNMMEHEYGFTPGGNAPRMKNHRAETCITQAILESVARVFLFAQTSVDFEAGRPDIWEDRDGRKRVRAQPFDITQLTDVLIVANQPTRDVIKDTFHKSLAYTITTSTHGTNVMSSVAESAGLQLEKIFMAIPDDADSDTSSYFDTRNNLREPERANWPSMMENHGVSADALNIRAQTLRESRISRIEFRERAKYATVNQAPTVMDAIRSVAGGDATLTKRYSTAIFPTFAVASMHYSSAGLLQWAMACTVDGTKTIATPMEYKPLDITEVSDHRLSEGNDSRTTATTVGASADRYDFCWLGLQGCGSGPRVHSAHHIMASDGPVKAFGYHDGMVMDCMRMLSTKEFACQVTEMPTTKFANGIQPRLAFVDSGGCMANKDSQDITLRKIVDAHGNFINARAAVATLDCRLEGNEFHTSKVAYHKELDHLNNFGRLPALLPYTSPRVDTQPMMKFVNNGTLKTLYVNVSRIYEIQCMIAEAVINAAYINGLKNRCEGFLTLHNSTYPHNFHAVSAPNGDPSSANIVTQMPYSNDILQILWICDFAKRLYIDKDFALQEIEKFHKKLRKNVRAPDDASSVSANWSITPETLPQTHLPVQSFPGQGSTEKKLKQISLDPRFQQIAPATFENRLLLSTERNKLSPYEFQEARKTYTHELGRPPSDEEMKKKYGSSGDIVSGDINDYATWVDYSAATLLNKGFVYPDFRQSVLVDESWYSRDRLDDNDECDESVRELDAYDPEAAWKHDEYWMHKTEQRRKRPDGLLESLMDAELMLRARYVEREAILNAESGQNVLRINGFIAARTFNAEEREEQRQADTPSNGVHLETVAQFNNLPPKYESRRNKRNAVDDDDDEEEEPSPKPIKFLRGTDTRMEI